MKKIALLFFAALAIASCSTDKGYTLDVTVTGLEGDIYLSLLEGKQPVCIDTATIVNGTAQFKGVLDLPMMASITDSKGAGVRFFLENSKITVSGRMEGNDKDSIAVTGSAMEDEYNAFYSKESAYELDTVLNYITSNPKSIAAAYTLFRNVSYRLGYEDLEKYVGGFDSTIRNSVYIKMTQDKVAKLKRTAVGEPFLDFTLPTPAGEEIALSSVAGKGKYVLIDFWASWCAPCRGENPNVVAAYAKYAPQGFEIVGVSLDRKAEDWTKAIAEDNLTWIHVSDLKFWNSAPAAEYGVGAIPSNVLIDPAGIIIGRNLIGEELIAKLAEIFPDKK